LVAYIVLGVVAAGAGWLAWKGVLRGFARRNGFALLPIGAGIAAMGVAALLNVPGLAAFAFAALCFGLVVGIFRPRWFTPSWFKEEQDRQGRWP
jgi:hypothetical protein